MSNWGTTPQLPDLLPSGGRRLTYGEAAHEALELALEDDRVRVFGEGVPDVGGTYGLTKGLREKFGDRVFDTPTAEQIITGVGVGMAIGGLRPVVIHPRNDFMLLALDQIANHAAKWGTMTGSKVFCPLTIISVACRGWGSAAQHSQALHSMIAQFPGIDVAVPFSPEDAKAAIWRAACCSERPTAVMLDKWLWKLVGPVLPKGQYQWAGQWPRFLCEGDDVTIVSISYGTAQAFMAAEKLWEKGITTEVFDLRYLKPLKVEPIAKSVEKTGRLVVVDTGHIQYGASAEIVAAVNERVAVKSIRIGMPNRPVPASNETDYFPGVDDIVGAVETLL